MKYKTSSIGAMAHAIFRSRSFVFACTDKPPVSSDRVRAASDLDSAGERSVVSRFVASTAGSVGRTDLDGLWAVVASFSQDLP